MCDGLDEAIEWAKKVPLRPGSKIEVRAIMDLSPYGYESSTLRPSSVANGAWRALEPVAAPDHLEHDLVGAGADPVEAGVAVGALDLVLLHVAVAAVDLDRVVGDLLDHS